MGQGEAAAQNLFNAVGYAGLHGGRPAGDKWDGCTTKNFSAWRSPSRRPGSRSSRASTSRRRSRTRRGLTGNAATVFGGNEANGNYTIGVGADIFQKYRVDLKYIDCFGRYKDNGTAVTSRTASRPCSPTAAS